MNEGLLPRRYAKALYEFAAEKNADERVYDLMKTLAGSFVSASGMQELLGNPYIADADKIKVLLTAAGAADTDTVYMDFLRLLAKNRRLDAAHGVAIAYISLYRELHNIHEVRIMSAAPLSDEEESRLRSLVARHLGGGTMEYSYGIDPALIGGFTVSVGNQRIDASVSNELKLLRLNLLRK